MELKDIRSIRKKLGLTQSELAKKAGISQSLIAKTEAGLVEPAYSKAKQLMDTLMALGEKNELKAQDIMKRRIISVAPGASMKDTIRLMKRHEISQLPVIENDMPVGMVSESIILDAIMEEKNGSIYGIMKEAPPIVSGSTAVSALSALMRFFPLVLVSDNGKLKGLITKSDIINTLS